MHACMHTYTHTYTPHQHVRMEPTFEVHEALDDFNVETAPASWHHMATSQKLHCGEGLAGRLANKVGNLSFWIPLGSVYHTPYDG
jgi:hypothetical protein